VTTRSNERRRWKSNRATAPEEQQRDGARPPLPLPFWASLASSFQLASRAPHADPCPLAPSALSARCSLPLLLNPPPPPPPPPPPLPRCAVTSTLAPAPAPAPPSACLLSLLCLMSVHSAVLVSLRSQLAKTKARLPQRSHQQGQGGSGAAADDGGHTALQPRRSSRQVRGCYCPSPPPPAAAAAATAAPWSAAARCSPTAGACCCTNAATGATDQVSHTETVPLAPPAASTSGESLQGPTSRGARVKHKRPGKPCSTAPASAGLTGLSCLPLWLSKGRQGPPLEQQHPSRRRCRTPGLLRSAQQGTHEPQSGSRVKAEPGCKLNETQRGRAQPGPSGSSARKLPTEFSQKASYRVQPQSPPTCRMPWRRRRPRSNSASPAARACPLLCSTALPACRAAEGEVGRGGGRAGHGTTGRAGGWFARQPLPPCSDLHGSKQLMLHRPYCPHRPPSCQSRRLPAGLVPQGRS
jgi:hypothetical protein